MFSVLFMLIDPFGNFILAPVLFKEELVIFAIFYIIVVFTYWTNVTLSIHGPTNEYL